MADRPFKFGGICSKDSEVMGVSWKYSAAKLCRVSESFREENMIRIFSITGRMDGVATSRGAVGRNSSMSFVCPSRF